MSSQPRQRATATAALCALAALAGGCGLVRAPNVVLITIDTLRADAVGAYGSPAPTPNLDRIARGGVLFERAIAPAAETAPSHATLLTGQGILRHRVTQNGVPLPEGVVTLAQRFQEAGYATAAFVSSFVLDARFGWSRGFDHYDDEFPATDATFHPEQISGQEYWTEFEFEGFDRRALETTRRAQAWIERAHEPFFLFVHYFDPHSPYAPPDEYVELLSRSRIRVGRRGVPGMGRKALRQILQRYHGEVLYVDEAVGRLLAELTRRGFGHRTLVVVTSDHGEGLGDHGWLSHQVHLYDEQLLVPLLMQWPGRLPSGLRVPSPVGLVDVAPTIAALARLPALPEAEGRSLHTALVAGKRLEPKSIFGYRRRYTQPYNGHLGEKFLVRSLDWKYIRSSHAPDELYDLASDPGELQNVHDARPDVVGPLASELDARLSTLPEGVPEPGIPDEVRRGLRALGYE